MALPFSILSAEHDGFFIPRSRLFTKSFLALICMCHSVSPQRLHIQTLLESLAWSSECMSSLQVSISMNPQGFNAMWCVFVCVFFPPVHQCYLCCSPDDVKRKFPDFCTTIQIIHISSNLDLIYKLAPRTLAIYMKNLHLCFMVWALRSTVVTPQIQ